MRPLHALCHLIFLLILASSISKGSIIEDTCKNVAANNKDVVDYDYCIKFFQADSGSATADKIGLVGIAMKITGEAAKSIAERIAALKASEKDQTVQECLRTCADLYSDTEYNLGNAVKDIASGTEKVLKTAMSSLSSAVDVPGNCDDGFSELDQKPLLAAENLEFTKKATIALSVAPSSKGT